MEIQLLPFHHPPSSLSSNGCKALNDKNRNTETKACELCADRALFTKLLQIYLIDTSVRMML